ncbi:Alpha/Beta hydrolase protein [Dichotomopilus funicola]|uniref:Alpha/Beta hydrolase protein n=1 Tax=Dichotomopilus funicola TaxID=1934379 RepID=A0AAN6V382_9PEZI|nr:Alpha/Beta hydrolase protein [Dichotomopilus funicola]
MTVRSPAQDIPTRVLGVIATELQIPLSELDDEAEFSELGVDDLVAPTIIARIAKETALRLPEDVFQDSETVGVLLKYLAALAPRPQTPPPDLPVKPRFDPRSLGVLIRRGGTVAFKAGNVHQPRNLFLLPDGSGAAMAYARLPALPNTTLYALNSPFLQDTAGYTCSIEQLAAVWVDAITAIQPRGPYMLGGWSAGGYYAYEVMKHLQRRGKIVDRVVLVDSPCRTNYEALPLAVVRHLASSGLMGDESATKGKKGVVNKPAPKRMVDHFASTLRAVERYKPIPLKKGEGPMPEVFLIWASEPLISEAQAEAAGLDSSVKVTRLLLLRSQADFGPNGWEKLFPGAKMAIARVRCHHFNIVHPPNAERLGSLLSDVVHPEGEAEWRNSWKSNQKSDCEVGVTVN